MNDTIGRQERRRLSASGQGALVWLVPSYAGMSDRRAPDAIRVEENKRGPAEAPAD